MGIVLLIVQAMKFTLNISKLNNKLSNLLNQIQLTLKYSYSTIAHMESMKILKYNK
jgi:hypothetical protein